MCIEVPFEPLNLVHSCQERQTHQSSSLMMLVALTLCSACVLKSADVGSMDTRNPVLTIPPGFIKFNNLVDLLRIGKSSSLKFSQLLEIATLPCIMRLRLTLCINCERLLAKQLSILSRKMTFSEVCNVQHDPFRALRGPLECFASAVAPAVSAVAGESNPTPFKILHWDFEYHSMSRVPVTCSPNHRDTRTDA